VRLYENDTKAQSSFLYHLSGGRLGSSGRLKSVSRFQLARSGSRQRMQQAMRVNEFLGARAIFGRVDDLEWKLDVPQMV
jgi:hypothetical protein